MELPGYSDSIRIGAYYSILLTVCASLMFTGFTARADEGAPSSSTFVHRAMATEFRFIVYSDEGDADATERIAREAFAAVDDLEARISSWVADSETTYLNRHAAEDWTRVSADMMDLLEVAKAIHERTGGAFDVTVGPLLDVWSIRADVVARPSAEALALALARVGLEKVLLDVGEGRVRFSRSGMRLDFGGIGKGLALDLAGGMLRERGVTQALLSAGTSTLLAIGAPPGEEGWTVHIRDPYNEAGDLEGVSLRDAAFSTSGCYGNLTDAEGGFACDILDPRSGMPAMGVLSASVVTARAVDADALSTALVVLGPEGARAFCAAEAGTKAVLVLPGSGPELTIERIGFNE